jgi:DNA-damage-inducible protein J
MKGVIIQTEINPELKEEAEAILQAMGLTTSEAIRVFLQQIVNSGGFPFPLSLPQPNDETRQALQELETGGGEVFESPNDLFTTWK